MKIFLIVIGIILLLVFGFGYLVTYTTIKNQANWDDFYKEVEKENPSILEEIIYRIICKMNFWSGVGLILGALLFISGIILQIILK